MKLIELISDVKLYKPDWTNRYIIKQISYQRALLLKNRLNQGVLINDVVKQVLQDVQVGIVDASELASFPSNVRILKSREPIPSLIARHNKPAFLSVRIPVITAEEFNLVPKENLQYVGNGRYNKREVFVTLYNNHIYIKLSKNNPKIPLITTLSVEGVFEEPTEVSIFNDPTIVGRDIWDIDYPISAADWSYIRGLILGTNEGAQNN